MCKCEYVVYMKLCCQNRSISASSESVPSGESQSVAGGDEDALDDYQELNTREEQDIESMMEVCEYAISNAEGFAEKLSRELQVLDGVRSGGAFEVIFCTTCFGKQISKIRNCCMLHLHY